MSVTITDVAKHAGVSIETVSRVINDGPFVVEATHAKVVAAMQELGYVPNASARRLASGRSPVLGLVFHNATWNHINSRPVRDGSAPAFPGPQTHWIHHGQCLVLGI